MKAPMYSYGLITGFCAAALYFMAPAIIDGFRPESNKQPVTPKSNFSIVEQYKGCDVVEYSPNNAARYYYFLHCPK